MRCVWPGGSRHKSAQSFDARIHALGRRAYNLFIITGADLFRPICDMVCPNLRRRVHESGSRRPTQRWATTTSRRMRCCKA